MEIKTENLGDVAQAMSEDIRATQTGIVISPLPYSVHVSDEHNFVVDLANFKFKSSKKDMWHGLELPQMDKDECREFMKTRLSEWARV